MSGGQVDHVERLCRVNETYHVYSKTIPQQPEKYTRRLQCRNRLRIRVEPGRQWAVEIGCAFYEDYRTMLAEMRPLSTCSRFHTSPQAVAGVDFRPDGDLTQGYRRVIHLR